jgi:hypothetical protein
MMRKDEYRELMTILDTMAEQGLEDELMDLPTYRVLDMIDLPRKFEGIERYDLENAIRHWQEQREDA